MFVNNTLTAKVHALYGTYIATYAIHFKSYVHTNAKFQVLRVLAENHHLPAIKVFFLPP
jgi:hypothetical protein